MIAQASGATAFPSSSVVAATSTAQAPPIGGLVWSRQLSDSDGRDYDAFVADAPDGHFMQTRAWAPMARADRPFASSYVIARDVAGHVVGTAHVLRARVAGLSLPYAIIERGPVVRDAAMFAPVLRQLGRAARRRGIVRLAVMPYWRLGDGGGAGGGAGDVVLTALARLGWRSVQTPDGAHAATLRLDVVGHGGDAPPEGGLGPPASRLFQGAEHKKLRQEIRYAERAGARPRRGGAGDLPRFASLYRDLMAEQGLHAKSDDWFRALVALGFGPDGPGGLFFTEHQSQIVAGALAIRHGDLVTLYLAASARASAPPSLEVTPKFSKMVPCLVAAVEWARGMGCAFDLGGVPMSGDTDAKRLSIARFKGDFSKARLTLIGQHARWLIGRSGPYNDR